MIDPFNFYEYSMLIYQLTLDVPESRLLVHLLETAQQESVDIVLWARSAFSEDTAGHLMEEGYYGRVLLLWGTWGKDCGRDILHLGNGRTDHLWLPEREAENVATPSFILDWTTDLDKLPMEFGQNTGIMGLNVWPNDHSAKNTMGFFPWSRTKTHELLRGRLELWDYWTPKKPIVAIGTNLWSVKKEASKRMGLPSRIIRTQVLVPEPLSFQYLGNDKRLIKEALVEGRVSVMFSPIGWEKGFRYWIEQGQQRYPMGSEMLWHPDQKLKAISPVPSQWKIFCNGKVEYEGTGLVQEYPVRHPGTWRVEIYRGHHLKPWLISNPVYVRSSEV
ncbi:hypothetical protein [Sulfobacillus thermosulfidooxidans]|uniref:hypothetical protein n=1 Tax=Sulfobacillus thermosulfidooxidans TaxID=28034 RepID=UPI00048F8EA4|nr:hypothetical protein [Sulfobacillus thermosulfidooxidans]